MDLSRIARIVILLVFLLPTIQYSSHTIISNYVTAQNIDNIWQCSNPESEIYRREGLPTHDTPQFVSILEADEILDDTDVVLGLEIDGEARAYPLDILRYHEVVNDARSDSFTAVTYCPVTGSGLAFSLDQLEGSSIGVTGILFESNLVFYDRLTDSCFSQMLAHGVSGERSSISLEYLPIQRMPWSSWKALYPDSVVLSREHPRFEPSRYDTNLYEAYENNEDLWFSLNFPQTEPYNLYSTKHNTAVVQSEGNTTLFPFEELQKNPVTLSKVGNASILIVHDFFSNVTSVFEVQKNNEKNFTFYPDFVELPESMGFGMFAFNDSMGNIYNIKGEVINGPQTGDVLQNYPWYEAFWFSAITFFSNGVIFQQDNPIQYQIEPYLSNIFNPETEGRQQIVIVAGILSVVILVIVINKLNSIHRRVKRNPVE